MKWLKVLGELLLELDGVGIEFTLVHGEALEKLLRHVLEEAKRLKQAWEALSDEDKLTEIAAKAPWKRSRIGEGEYVAADLVPSLVQAVKAKQGRLYAGGYVYVLSKNGKWLQRYPRGGRK